MPACLVKLAPFAMLAAFVAASYGPGLRGYGGNPVGAVLTTGVLVLGCYAVGRTYEKPALFSIYGWLMSFVALACILPGANDYSGMATGSGILWYHVSICSAYVILTGVFCRISAGLGWAMAEHRIENEAGDSCRKCGYLLRGLTEARCPECGTLFDLRPWIEEEENREYLERLENEEAPRLTETPFDATKESPR